MYLYKADPIHTEQRIERKEMQKRPSNTLRRTSKTTNYYTLCYLIIYSD